MRLPFSRPRPVHDTVVTAVTPLTSAMVRITLTGPTLPALAFEQPTQWAKLTVADPAGAPVSRAYTVRHHRPGPGEADFDVVLHGRGPFARWAAAARPGEPVRIAGPRGRLRTPEGAGHLLLVADESAQPAALALLAALPRGFPVLALLETGLPQDTLPCRTAADAAVHWLPRAGTGHRKGELLLESVRDAALPPGRGAAWVAGEAGAVTGIRRHLLGERGFEREGVRAKGYWKAGEADHRGGAEQ
ncbi:siderophore-interacting protein [Kitasatospora sp. NBC_00240]|uniref:siderophore-interacting protein n=1 Tax=Kitasatospora sp. NBC_00240 TaxID=2903567 RepID=UPI00225647C5|nr:siderophore-interacting protein [Kitasatospora sp. NBC_00240]MCX5209862.1 siderophore-interacting protein [Kitasatospora sp. NBC_00240]